MDFVIFPEMTLTGFTLNPETYGEDRKNSPSMAFFREEAKKNHVAICYGLPVYENGIATNHCIILDENGNVTLENGHFKFRDSSEAPAYLEERRELEETAVEVAFSRWAVIPPENITLQALEALSVFLSFKRKG